MAHPSDTPSEEYINYLETIINDYIENETIYLTPTTTEESYSITIVVYDEVWQALSGRMSRKALAERIAHKIELQVSPKPEEVIYINHFYIEDNTVNSTDMSPLEFHIHFEISIETTYE